MFLFYYFYTFFVFTFLSTCLPVGPVFSLCLSSLAIFVPRIARPVDAILGNVSTLLKPSAENAQKENEPGSEEESIHGMVAISCIFLRQRKTFAGISVRSLLFSASAFGPIWVLISERNSPQMKTQTSARFGEETSLEPFSPFPVRSALIDCPCVAHRYDGANRIAWIWKRAFRGSRMLKSHFISFQLINFLDEKESTKR